MSNRSCCGVCFRTNSNPRGSATKDSLERSGCARVSRAARESSLGRRLNNRFLFGLTRYLNILDSVVPGHSLSTGPFGDVVGQIVVVFLLY